MHLCPHPMAMEHAQPSSPNVHRTIHSNHSSNIHYQPAISGPAVRRQSLPNNIALISNERPFLHPMQQLHAKRVVLALHLSHSPTHQRRLLLQHRQSKPIQNTVLWEWGRTNDVHHHNINHYQCIPTQLIRTHRYYQRD